MTLDSINPQPTVEEFAKDFCKGNKDLEKKFTEILYKLVTARDNLFHHSSPPPRYIFKSGDIVYNRKTEEFGFIVGTIDPWSTSPEDPSHSRGRRYLMVTLCSECPELAATLATIQGKDPSTLSMLAGKGYFSIRYPKQVELELIITEDTDEDCISPKEIKEDIQQFCTKQCIAECSDLCSFYKYGKYPKP